MWDTETSPGPSKAEDTLIEQFEQKYPNVTVKRVVKNFDDYMATIKLAASSATRLMCSRATRGTPPTRRWSRPV